MLSIYILVLYPKLRSPLNNKLKRKRHNGLCFFKYQNDEIACVKTTPKVEFYFWGSLTTSVVLYIQVELFTTKYFIK